MKKFILSVASFFLPAVALAHNIPIEEPSFADKLTEQLREFSPLEHWEEGHWFAVALSIVLWMSLAYVIYSSVKKPKNVV